mmetsp:Transcript_36040/g.111532  ORF Transcript_36040/g.111532 Transcript_36040/m.111532 type:complete len:234 (-) Transcript_36040:125-826(-)
MLLPARQALRQLRRGGGRAESSRPARAAGVARPRRVRRAVGRRALVGVRRGVRRAPRVAHGFYRLGGRGVGHEEGRRVRVDRRALLQPGGLAARKLALDAHAVARAGRAPSPRMVSGAPRHRRQGRRERRARDASIRDAVPRVVGIRVGRGRNEPRGRPLGAAAARGAEKRRVSPAVGAVGRDRRVEARTRREAAERRRVVPQRAGPDLLADEPPGNRHRVQPRLLRVRGRLV